MKGLIYIWSYLFFAILFAILGGETATFWQMGIIGALNAGLLLYIWAYCQSENKKS